MGPGARRHRRDEHGRRFVAADGMERGRAGTARGGAGRAVERGDLFRQLGVDRRHRAGGRQGVARRHDGAAQHVRLCRRVYRPARCRAGARLGGKPGRLGLGVRPSRPDHADGPVRLAPPRRTKRGCKPWRPARPSEFTAARCSGAGKWSRRRRPGRQVRRCRSSAPRRRAAMSRRTDRA